MAAALTIDNRTFWAEELNVRESDVRACDESSCKYGGVCKEDGDGLKCACQFQHPKPPYYSLLSSFRIVVVGSGGLSMHCFLVLEVEVEVEVQIMALDLEKEEEGSGAEAPRKHSKCGPCKYKAECDEDAENVGCVCNIDCSGYSFNPVCASDGSSYNNPCFVREASCIKQEQIDIRHLGHCTDTDDTSLLGKKDDGLQYRPDVKDAGDQREDVYIGSHMPCPENLNGYCIHGKCEFIYSTQKASCRCESGYTGQHCEKTDFSILYVVPSRQKLTHVLIAAIIGAVQIAIIVAIVMCITRGLECTPSEIISAVRLGLQRNISCHFGAVITLRGNGQVSIFPTATVIHHWNRAAARPERQASFSEMSISSVGTVPNSRV
ncbi:Tomoregulin-1 [Microtus ochrogaster]|uniref:Tomoregulin-1 n=1 Tax=Microtus ochrogaster TaxID=79684 RepID=A0A8J6G250_MICOH|nr:Tomoregulin-1 [Microtus ochrogaster]